MKIIDEINEETENGRFDIPGGGWVHLRLLSSNDVIDINKECGKKDVEYPLLGDGDKASYHRFETFDFDSEKEFKMTIDRTILDWGGKAFENGDGKVIECSIENKVLVAQRSKTFQIVYRNGRDALKKADSDKIKALEKNLSSGSSGKTNTRRIAKAAK